MWYRIECLLIFFKNVYPAFDDITTWLFLGQWCRQTQSWSAPSGHHSNLERLCQARPYVWAWPRLVVSVLPKWPRLTFYPYPLFVIGQYGNLVPGQLIQTVLLWTQSRLSRKRHRGRVGFNATQTVLTRDLLCPCLLSGTQCNEHCKWL